MRKLALIWIVVLASSGPAMARGTVWYGEHQSVENGSVTARVPARTVNMNRGTPTGPSPYRCTFQAEGEAKTVTFTPAECLRRGSHLLCAKKTAEPSEARRGWTGVVCWGDVYLKPAPGDAGAE